MIHRTFAQLPELTIDDFYTAGQKVAPGRYRLLGTQRDVCLEGEDTLPASLDGKVAVYVKQPATWADLHRGVKADRSEN